MSDEEDDIVLSELSDEDLVQQMHDDLYDGLTEEIEEGTHILLDRGWGAEDVLGKALVDGMTIVGIDFRDGILFVPEVLLAAKDAETGSDNPELIGEVPPRPHIVIAQMPVDIKPTVGQFSDAPQQPNRPFGNDMFPLKPEVDQITDQVQGLSLASHLVQPTQEHPFPLP